MKVFEKTKMLTDAHMHYCPGCTHGIVHRLVAESIEELGLQDKCIGIAPVGCAVFAYDYFNCDMQEAAHGRAPAVATGIKRCLPDRTVFVYQGDGDLASIGMAETVHAAARGENITIIFINNSIYGMTGGQMAPTTLIGQKATTCQNGRDPAVNGYPIRVCELLATLDAPYYIERVSTHDVKHVLAAKKAIKKALRFQSEGRGYTFVEVLVSCPTNWHMQPVDALRFMGEECTKTFPLGVYRDKSAERGEEYMVRILIGRTGRPGRAQRGQISRRKRPARGEGSLLSPRLRPGNARRHGKLFGHHLGGGDRLPPVQHARRAHRAQRAQLS